MNELSLADGRYRLLQRLGEGGMAAVYRGWDSEKEREVAIKVLRAPLARRRRTQRRFANEARMMANLNHRHVISIYDVGVAGNIPYIVMELADGGSLYDWLQHHGPMPSLLAVQVLMQVCKGIRAAHERQVIHRDIKPHNVLITAQGVCKLTDFGIAQLQDEDAASMTRTGSAMGTIGFMAPEQRNDAKSVDERADIYSLGATLFCLLTRQNVPDLFLAEHDPSILHDVPEALGEIILKATAYRREERYPDVQRMIRALHLARRYLPPIPEHTPSLILPPHAVRVAAEGSQTCESFLEIEALLTQSAPERTSSATDPPADEPSEEAPRPLPYQMPSRDPLPTDSSASLPDYLAPSAVQTVTPRPIIEVGVSSDPPRPAALARSTPTAPSPRQRSATPAPSRVRTQGLDVGDNLTDLILSSLTSLGRMLTQPLKIAAIPAVLITGIFAWNLGVGAVELREAAHRAHTARDQVYHAIEAERLIIDELTALGGSRHGLEASYRAAMTPMSEPNRYDAALRYLRLLESQLAIVSRDPSPVMVQRLQRARERIHRIAGATATHDEAVRAWEASSREGRGAMAVRAGIAPAP